MIKFICYNDDILKFLLFLDYETEMNSKAIGTNNNNTLLTVIHYDVLSRIV
jgi:hypothetical protein